MPFEAAKETSDMAETDWFEIFRAGKYEIENGAIDEYDEADLDSMAAAVNAREHVVPVVIGHHDTDDPRTAELVDGYLKEAKREGDKLLVKADLSPDITAKWKDNKLLTWSAGIYKDFQNTGRRVLQHVAALGKTPPRVKGLQYKPTFVYSDAIDDGSVYVFSETPDAEIETPNQTEDNMADEKELNELKLKLLASERDKRAALDAVSAKDKEIAAAKQTAQFAELDKQVQIAHLAGYPKAQADNLRTVIGAAMGLMDDKGVVTFAEGKTAKFSDALTAVLTCERVPQKNEADDIIPKPSTPIDGKDALKKLDELTVAKFSELKDQEGMTYGKAMHIVLNEHPELKE